ncbi:GNAT family N-acetyltransferase [Nocardioides ferulae]|uniref:GNAT family N-acetyltransferase n=1 Tax=Nocardioides ferulae TaxID=2340821 RepID=UPI000EB02E8E|nr:GNAT family N-acetyltransferase [Nocardioides ferulae]
MLWRVRTTLPDRPGALAGLAHDCGVAGVNILGLQIFPGIEAVTDELVLRTPDDWGVDRLTELVQGAGGHTVVAAPCTEAALTDQPARYVRAARSILAQPASFPEVVAQLFDAEADPPGGTETLDVMEMTVGDVVVQVHRKAPFTATEHARGAAIADLVGDVLGRSHPAYAVAPGLPGPSGRRMGGGTTVSLVRDGDTVSAVADETVVGVAVVRAPAPDEPAARPVTLRVDPGWQRRGIGTRLLLEGARLAHDLGAGEIVLTTRADNQAALPMVLATGLRGRIRMAADMLTVRVPVRDLRPVSA